MKKTTRKVPQSVKTQRKIDAAVDAELQKQRQTGLVVPDWRGGWKWFSNLALAAIVAINTAPIPPEVLDGLSPDARQQVTIGLAVVGILGRFINQSRKKDDADV